MRVKRKSAKRPVLGLLEWFRPGESEQVERVLRDLAALKITALRTGVSWAEWHTPAGQSWYKWLLPRLAREVQVLPCLCYTPPSLGLAPSTSSPPREIKAYADFVDEMITLFGQCFEWIELWNLPNNQRFWDVTLDPQWTLFSQMLGSAAFWAHQRGKKTVLGGLSPIDPHWLRMMFARGVMQHVDAIGVHGYPGTYEYQWQGWKDNLAKVREVLREFDSHAQVWITETGYSTWRHDERKQLLSFIAVLQAPAERLYWYSARDLNATAPTRDDGCHSDEREYHFGLRQADGAPKLLCRLWEQGGLERVQEAAWLAKPTSTGQKQKPILITGGSGFVGTNLAHRLAACGRSVLLFDNLSRPGVEENLAWLKEVHGGLIQVEVADVRDRETLEAAVRQASHVYHFAAQVAVTTSLQSPFHDFDINARGTLNLLEALRATKNPPPLLFTSTNKVYGDLSQISLLANATRYIPTDAELAAHGVGEQLPVDFHSPYVCSKGCAEQYILDYARTFSLPTVVFRMSCIYGPHQFGTVDQGWVAHFLIRAVEGRPITLYGDGKQVRDLLFVEDLLDAMLLAQEHIQTLSGEVFNIGGGPRNTTSLLELVELITALHRETPKVNFQNWRLADQRYYVSDTRKLEQAIGWAPKYNLSSGIEKLYQWLLRWRYSAPRLVAPQPRRISSVSYAPLSGESIA